MNVQETFLPRGSQKARGVLTLLVGGKAEEIQAIIANLPPIVMQSDEFEYCSQSNRSDAVMCY